jgi:Lhr-like helicase
MQVQELKSKAYVDFFAGNNVTTFNAVQTQVYPALHERDDNCFVAAPAGSGSRVLAELAIFRMLTETERKGRYVCVCVCVCVKMKIYMCVRMCMYIYIVICVFVRVCVYT